MIIHTHGWHANYSGLLLLFIVLSVFGIIGYWQAGREAKARKRRKRNRRA